jgi:tRNA 2-thiocytidine biosynthesis protein TtcA
MSRFVKAEMRRLMGKAIHKYSMTEEGDHILVSVSGGKDSMALLWLMRERLRRLPIEYKITAVHVDPGFGGDNAAQMKDFFEDQKFDYRILSGDFGPKAHSSRNQENPCFMCSRIRRKYVFELAAELKCNKIAMGHHKDDIIETLFINMFYGASVSTMLPVQELFDGTLKVIRPLFMTDEQMIKRYVCEMEFPLIKMGCPTSGKSKRRNTCPDRRSG